MPRMSCKGARRLRIALTILPFFQRLGRVYKHTAEQLHVNIAVHSETYEKLSDPRSGLYFQAPGYVYDFLNKEIEYGKMQ